jgi:hypothetical protein
MGLFDRLRAAQPAAPSSATTVTVTAHLFDGDDDLETYHPVVEFVSHAGSGGCPYLHATQDQRETTSSSANRRAMQRTEPLPVSVQRSTIELRPAEEATLDRPARVGR